MKKVFSIAMVFVLILPTITKVGILVDFKINQNFIAKVLCIEKDVPMSNCDGKCYLAQQLKKAQKQEKKHAPQNTKDKVEIVYYNYTTNYNYTLFRTSDIKKTSFVYKTDLKDFGSLSDIFHPPKLV